MMNVSLQAPLDVQIEITSRCNHRCRHCYNYWKYELGVQKESTLSSRDLNFIFHQLKRNKVLSVTITGGEPFLYPKRVLRCLKLAKEVDIMADINSNLTLLNNQIIEELSGFNNIAILVSLISANEKIHDMIVGSRGAFKRTIDNIQKCIKSGIKISVSMVLTKANFSDIYKTAKFVKNLGITTFCATRAVPPLGCPDYTEYCLTTKMAKEALNELLRVDKELNIRTDILNSYPKCLMFGSDALKKFSHRICVAGQTTMTIGSEGEVRPCSHSDASYGNILTERLEEIWVRMSEWRDGSLLPSFCKDKCVFSKTCSGGCRISARYHGDIKDMDPDVVPKNLENYTSPEEEVLDERLLELQINSDQFVVNPGVVLRCESFGGIAYVKKTRQMIAINQKAYAYLQNCLDKGCQISISDFLFASKAKNEKERPIVYSLFRRLIVKEILISSSL